MNKMAAEQAVGKRFRVNDSYCKDEPEDASRELIGQVGVCESVRYGMPSEMRWPVKLVLAGRDMYDLFSWSELELVEDGS